MIQRNASRETRGWYQDDNSRIVTRSLERRPI